MLSKNAANACPPQFIFCKYTCVAAEQRGGACACAGAGACSARSGDRITPTASGLTTGPHVLAWLSTTVEEVPLLVIVHLHQNGHHIGIRVQECSTPIHSCRSLTTATDSWIIVIYKPLAQVTCAWGYVFVHKGWGGMGHVTHCDGPRMQGCGCCCPRCH